MTVSPELIGALAVLGIVVVLALGAVFGDVDHDLDRPLPFHVRDRYRED